jgi:hypothetical protein
MPALLGWTALSVLCCACFTGLCFVALSDTPLHFTCFARLHLASLDFALRGLLRFAELSNAAPLHAWPAVLGYAICTRLTFTPLSLLCSTNLNYATLHPASLTLACFAQLIFARLSFAILH